MPGDAAVRRGIGLTGKKGERHGLYSFAGKLWFCGRAGHTVSFPARKRLGRGVQAGMDAALLCFAEQLQEEIHLHQRLASAGRDAALVSPVAAVALRPVEQLVRRILRAFLQTPPECRWGSIRRRSVKHCLNAGGEASGAGL